MKTKLLFFVALAFLMNANCLLGQQRTDYSIVELDQLDPYKNVSSTYFNGYTFAIYNQSLSGETELHAQCYYMHTDGSITRACNFRLAEDLPLEFNVTSCLYKRNLYAFYWDQNGNQPCINYVKIRPWLALSYDSLQINETISEQMAAVSYNDTIYIFFVDEADKLVKYYTIAFSEELEKLALVSETPSTVSNSNTSIGNVAAITFVDDSLQEQIMVAFPGSILDRANNDIYVYTGIPDQLEFYAQKACAYNYSAHGIAMAQGSVKGGSNNSYNIQFGYTHANDESGWERCELKLNDNTFSDWESLDGSGALYGKYTWFMEFYSKGTQVINKYLLQGANGGMSAQGALWESDRLEYKDQKSQVPPLSHASNFFDVVLVVEGAPPYALNGHKLTDDCVGEGSGPLSTFSFTKVNEQSLSATTTYTQSIETNMGAGPVTAGFKASFMESSGTSYTESVSITNKIIPPLSNSDSSGVMWYYYIAPTVIRSRWAMEDYNGNVIEPNRNLFFFNFTSPVMSTMTYDLSDSMYGDNSPRAYDLNSYENRGVLNMSGIDEIFFHQASIDIAAGGSETLDLTFTNTETDSYDASYEVSLGIEAEGEIFSASVGASAGVEYSRERTTTCSNSFYIDWKLSCEPTNPTDTNIVSYSPIAYIMKTTDSTAYFLPDGLKNYKPFFVTYEVTNIEKGVFSGYSIDENNRNVGKYKFSNYPNPCSDKTVFSYLLQSKSNVNLSIYNTYGHKVGTPINEAQSSGNHQFDLQTSALSSGMYFYRMLIGEDLITGKIIKN
jgi:hypothetical protein